MSRKVALVTGAGKRIGQAIATHLAGIGYDVAVHFNSSAADAEITKREIEKKGGRAELIQIDLRALHSGKELIERTIAAFGRLDLLVNNASTFSDPDAVRSTHGFLAETEEEFETAVAVNARAPFFLIRHGASHMKDGSVVINILDTAGLELKTSRSAHSVSKAALRQITLLAAEALKGKVTVVSLLLQHVIPGDKATPEVIAKYDWTGLAPVVQAVEDIVRRGAKSGTTIEVL